MQIISKLFMQICLHFAVHAYLPPLAVHADLPPLAQHCRRVALVIGANKITTRAPIRSRQATK